MINLITEESVLAFALRFILGIMFFMQGYDKVINIKMEGVVRTVNNQYLDKNFPEWLVKVISYLTSYIELIGGLLLILGLFKTLAMYLLLLDLVIVSFGMSLLNPIWDMRYVLPRLIILTALILFPDNWDVLSFDNIRVMAND